MKYDIYFHNDFDGRASAAVMLNFLRGRGDDIENFAPVNFDLQEQWSDENFFEKHKLFRGPRNPAIVADFFYHPRAAFWFDHHPTTFKKEIWRKNFNADKSHRLQPEYSSCCHQVLDDLKHSFKFRPPKYLRELAFWLDIMDGGKYPSAKDIVFLRKTAYRVGIFVDKTAGNPRATRWFIEKLSRRSLSGLAREPMFRKVMRPAEGGVKKSVNLYKEKLRRFGKLTYIDLTDIRMEYYENLRYVPYWVYPKTVYALRLVKRGAGYHVGLGVNPWQSAANKAHIGEFLQKYGGGGHRNVGGAEFKSKKKAEALVKIIIKRFQ